jgi:hypothetical protein
MSLRTGSKQMAGLLSPRSLSYSVAGVAFVFFAALAFPSCGGGGTPSGSTPSASPTPVPTPTPPTTGGGGSAASCKLGPGDLNAECEKTSPKLQNAVFEAMDKLVQQRPQIFDLTDEAGANTRQYKVVDKEAYLNGMVATLIAAGNCSERDPDDGAYERILVKNENGFSENFDILTVSGYMRRNGTYFETCTPASFPVDRGGLPAPGSGCGWPYPPPISRMNCKLHLYGPDYYTLDSTVIVGPDGAYCADAGFTDGRALCPVRPPDSAERVPCETWIAGKAKDTGKPGPTWTVNGQYCTGPASGCEHHPTDPYALLVYKSGAYQVCANTGSCCTVEVER